jgi:hypothetical protein
VEHHAGSSSEQRWQKSASKRLRFASNVAEFTVASWTIPHHWGSGKARRKAHD